MLRDILQKGIVVTAIVTTLYFGSFITVSSVDIYQRAQIRKVTLPAV